MMIPYSTLYVTAYVTFSLSSLSDPINIFFGVYKTDNAPIRLSYHHGVHYNSVVDPYTATVGVGLGLAGHKPGVSYFSRNTVYLDLYHLKRSCLYH